MGTLRGCMSGSEATRADSWLKASISKMNLTRSASQGLQEKWERGKRSGALFRMVFLCT